MSRPPEKPKRKNNNRRAWTLGEDERLLQLIISNASVIDIAAELGRTVQAVSARLRPTDRARPLAVSRKAKMTASLSGGGQ